MTEFISDSVLCNWLDGLLFMKLLFDPHINIKDIDIPNHNETWATI